MASGKNKAIFTMAAFVLIVIAAVVTSVIVMHYVSDNNKHDSSYTSANSLTTSEITKQVITKMGYKDVKELDSGNVSAHFVLPQDSVTQTSVYISTSADSAFEIDCFKLSENSSYEDVSNAISEHMKTKAKGFQDSPEQKKLIDNYVVKRAGEFVFVAVTENAEAAAKAFDDIVEKK